MCFRLDTQETLLSGRLDCGSAVDRVHTLSLPPVQIIYTEICSEPASSAETPYAQISVTSPSLAALPDWLSETSGVSRKRKVIRDGCFLCLEVTPSRHCHHHIRAFHGDVLSIQAADTGTLQSSHAGYTLVLCLPVYRPFASSLLAFCLPSPP